MNDTIAAPAGGASCAISLIRLSGPCAAEIAGKFLSKNGKPPVFRDKTAALMRVTDGGALIDRAIVTYFQGPDTFTGEDIVEIACHGSPYIIGKIMGLALADGARAAAPGEFSMRAFQNGKMDLAQAEGLCDLIRAGTACAHKAALSLLEGGPSRKFSAIREKLVDALAEFEARLDDADEEMPPLDSDKAASALADAASEIRVLLDTFRAGRLIRDGARACIVGAPNCGKSSLLNALLGFDRAIVSPSEGTTRDTVEETLELSGCALRLIDTAGIREHALDPAETEGMARTKKAVSKSDIVIFVSDASRPGEETGAAVRSEIEKLAGPDTAVINVLNKIDMAPSPRKDMLSVSCKTGAGIAALRDKIAETLSPSNRAENSVIITNARHYRALSRAAGELEEAIALLKGNPAAELCAEHINSALRELELLAGKTAPEDILKAVFSKFCVGK